MDIEALRTYCLSLSPEVEEKFPFQKFRAARDVLVFYIGGHMFCYFDINDLSRVSMKCSEEEAILLREQYDCIGLPYNANKNFAQYWIGIDITRADDELIKRLIKGSLEIVGKKSITV